jgi:maleylacetate reductase
VTTPNPGRPLAFQHQTYAQRVIFGAGCARSELAGEVKLLEASRVLAIAGGSAQAVAAELTAQLPVVAVFSDVHPHVPVAVAEAVRSLAAESRAEVVICIGGGSTIGTAKALALTSGLPIIAIPTTYAGSEVTPVWGLTDEQRKTTGTDVRVLPRTVLYDPELTTSLPVDLTVTSGLNALAHCIDALWAPKANPISSALAVAGIRALRAALPPVRRDGTNLIARADALYGAYLAAVAFAGAGAGLHHKICHVLGGAYGLPHAPMHAVVLPHVLAFNAPAVPRIAREIAGALSADPLGSGPFGAGPSGAGPFGAGPSGTGRREAGRFGVEDDAVAGLLALYSSLDAPHALRDLGLAETALPEAAALVTEAAPPSNPRSFGPADAGRLLRHAWAGDRPSSAAFPIEIPSPTAHGETAADSETETDRKTQAGSEIGPEATA